MTLTSLFNLVPTAANIDHYVDTILSRSRRRKMIQICREGLEAAGDITRDIDFSELQSRIAELGLEKSPDLQSLYDDLPDWYDWLSTPSTAVSTGFHDIDQILGGGWQPTDFAVIAARPAVGKSAFALQSAISAARFGVPTLFISLEMGKNLLISRAMAAAAHVPGIKLIRKNVTQRDIAKLHAQDDNIPDQLYLTDLVPSDYNSVINCIRMAMTRFKVRVIFIDYLQLIEADPEKNAPRYQQIGKVTRGLRQLARQSRISIIGLSQLSRKPEENGDKPTLSALRESGNIEQDACVVLGLYQSKDRHDNEVQNEKKPYIQAINVEVLKNRNGEITNAPLMYEFYRPFTLFSPSTIKSSPSANPVNLSKRQQKAADDLFHMPDNNHSTSA